MSRPHTLVQRAPVEIGEDDPITLAEAAELTGGTWPKSLLRKQAADGLLPTMLIGNKLFTTKADVARLQERMAAPFLGVEGNIYFVGYGAYVKIGYTRGDVAKRVRGLNTATPETIVIFAIVRGTPEDERALHARFTTLRLRGEWFKHEGALADHIAGLARG